MLDDDARGAAGELLHALEGGVRVGDVVEGELLALELAGARHRADLRRVLHVERRALVGILPVAQGLRPAELQAQREREGPVPARVLQAAEIVRDGAVVARGVRERLHCEAQAHRSGHGAPGGIQRSDHLRVVFRVDHDGHRVEVLGGGPQHRRTPDVDVLDRRREVTVRPVDRLLEGIEVHRHQVDGGDGVLGHRLVVETAPPEQAPVHLGVQRLQAAVHQLRKAGVVGDVHHRDTVLAEHPRRAARREDLEAARDESARQVHDAGLVGNADQRPPRGTRGAHERSSMP